MAFPGALHQLGESNQVVFDLIASLDECFIIGFANLDDQHLQTLQGLVRVFTGTPLQQSLTDAVAAISSNEFLDKHFAVLASARAAIQGALFDTLKSQVRSLLGRGEIAEAEFEESSESPNNVKVLLASVRHWLMEIALVGYARLDTATLVHFAGTLEQIQAEPLLIRQAALLTGYFNELMRHVPVVDSQGIPVYRWVDLWTQAMIGTLRPANLPKSQLISGNLEILGLDLRQHANLVSFTAYGLLDANNQTQLVRVTQSAYKVDAINNEQIWLLFPNATALLDAFAQTRILHLKDTPLLPTGDLLWQSQAELGQNYNLMERAEKFFAENAGNSLVYSTVAASDRHPIQLAEPIFFSKYKVIKNDENIVLSWGDAGELSIAKERISSLSELNLDAIAKSQQIFGLLRFDAGKWTVQPLAVTVKNKTIYTGQTAAQVISKKDSIKGSVVGILQERSSRLLRKG
ncbi:MAG: hypothetical protein KME32_23285 [Mojavia pulchra JT2-VF2]|jgi:hypothetical protein|uniref:Uncharacterized protein n=1 Tax=Mojavia pulchra JT2-VF2 TaxID=287848 RepID=A0A951Q259_9NOST|nr:hypothetical protein [Mojavia pulchra JT2-VF2]